MEQPLKKKLLSLARKVLENDLRDRNYDLESYNLKEFQEEGGLFVTLTQNGILRGCIGRIESQVSIYKNVIEMTKAAAFEDHRFEKLTAEDLNSVRIEISILTPPKEIEGRSAYDKLLKIKPKRDGVVLSANDKKATFLPQVWESIPIREDFISGLCRKAGLKKKYWEANDVKLSVYQVDKFEES